MLVLCKSLRLFVKILTDDEKYCLLYRDNLSQPFQILLSQKQKTYSQLFSTFLKSTLNYAHFQIKDDPHSWCVYQITVSENGDSINICKLRFKRSLPQKNMAKRPKDCRNLHNATFTMFAHPSEHNSVGKSLC